MVLVGMRHKDMAHRTPGNGRDQSLPMGFIVRARVNHGKRVASDDVAVGAMKGQRTAVARSHAYDVLTCGHGKAMRRLEDGIEGWSGHLFSFVPLVGTRAVFPLMIPIKAAPMSCPLAVKSI